MRTSPWPGFMRRNFIARDYGKASGARRARFVRRTRSGPGGVEAEDVDRPGARAELAQPVAHRAPPRPRAAWRAASSGSSPSARRAASVEECVQPEPCAAPSGWRSPGSSVSVAPSKSRSVASLAVAAGDDDARGPERVDARGRAPRRRASLASPASTARLGDVRRDDGRPREDQLDAARRGASAPAAARRTRRPSPGRATTGVPGRQLVERARDGLDRRDVAEHPDLHRVDAEVLGDRADLRRDDLRAATGCDRA